MKLTRMTKFYESNDKNRKWYLIDAEGQTLGRLATKVSNILRGKHKANFSQDRDLGDYVIVVNADKVRLTAGKEDKKVYYWHTGFIGGLKSIKASDAIKEKPEWVLIRTVRGMLPKNKLRNKVITRLKIYRGAEHPHLAQNPEQLSL